MKKAIITLMDDNFIFGWRVFLKSFRHHNPDQKIPFIILDAGLSQKSKDELTAAGMIIREIDQSAYSKVPTHGTHTRLQKTYWTLDVFRQADFDRLIFFDMDIVLTGSVAEIINWEMSPGCEIAACRAYNAKRDNLDHRINSGVFVLDTTGEKIFRKLLRLAEARPRSMPDQTIINEAFVGSLDFLPKKYNCEKRMMLSENHREIWESAVVIHYVAAKPWDQNKPEREKVFEPAEREWHKWT